MRCSSLLILRGATPYDALSGMGLLKIGTLPIPRSEGRTSENPKAYEYPKDTENPIKL
jgi:hypothetical protein